MSLQLLSTVLSASVLSTQGSSYYKPSVSKVAVAYFDGANNGIHGSVKVTDGFLTVDLDISGSHVDAECTNQGLGYHIHELWNYPDFVDRIEGECGRGFTGNHWDPWVACGPATDNDFCESDGGCVPGSSVLLDSPGYSCSEDTFKMNPYACEVGDWNGKYGNAMVNEYGRIHISESSPYEVSAEDLEGLSVVFHCNDGSRTFCAPFEITKTYDYVPPRPVQKAPQLVAEFDMLGSNSRVELNPDGQVKVALNYKKIDTSVCPNDRLALRIYNNNNDQYDARSQSYANACAAVTSFFDPTHTCAPDSDSDFCNQNGLLCGFSDYVYECDFNAPFDRFSCAPGDLTKLGTLPANWQGELYARDPLLIDLKQVSGKSLVLQCDESYEILACAELKESLGLCVRRCDTDSCAGMSENPHCEKEFAYRDGCQRCKEGFWMETRDYPCAACSRIEGCRKCRDFRGCDECEDGYTEVWDTSCGYGQNICVPY